MEEVGPDGSQETQSTWSDSETEKPRELLESEVLELRAVNKRQEQELQQLRKLLAYTECPGSESEVLTGDEYVAQLKQKLLTKDLFITQLEQSLSKRQQQLADELSRRKSAQYKHIQSGRDFCDLLHKCSEHQQESMRLESENLMLRQSAGQMPKADPKKNAVPSYLLRTAQPGPSGEECASPKTKRDQEKAGIRQLILRADERELGNFSPAKWMFEGGVWERRAGSVDLLLSSSQAAHRRARAESEP